MFWITSDTHFNHGNILRYTDRPWEDIHQHDNDLIANWNRVVGESDDVYHLGDFGFARPEILASYLEQLNGRIHHIKGNHDRSMTGPVARHLVWQKDYFELKVTDEEMDTTQRIVLSQYPMLSWNAAFHGSWMLHGHTHATLPVTDIKRIDVGVDSVARTLRQADSRESITTEEYRALYRPISYQEVKTIITRRALGEQNEQA